MEYQFVAWKLFSISNFFNWSFMYAYFFYLSIYRHWVTTLNQLCRKYPWKAQIHSIPIHNSNFMIWIYIIIIIIIMSCRQHGYPWPYLATSPYHSSLLAGLQGYIPYPHITAVCMYVRASRPAFAWPYAGVHWSTSLMSSSLLLQQCPACLVRLTCIVFVMGGRWPYSWCLVGCWRQDLFNIALNILV